MNDLNPNDIEYAEVDGAEGKLWRAMLGFCHAPSMVQFQPKFYIAHGVTRDDARAKLITVMQEALQKLV